MSEDQVRDQERELIEAIGIEDVLPPPGVREDWEDEPFLDGFTIKVVLGGLFVALFMLPGFIYMGLAIGANIGAGAEWVIALLFFEIARRSYQRLKRQELFMILHMSGSLSMLAGHVVISGGIFATLLFHFYQRNSTIYKSFNLTDQIPQWFAPTIEQITTRSFLQEAWLPAIVVALLGYLFFRIQYFGLGYLIFRITSDLEKLPFPMARVSSEGLAALAEAGDRETESWRWGVFAITAIIGAVWGFIYMGIPSISAALFGARTELIPIPFLDMTSMTEGIMPAALWGVGFDLTLIFVGFVLPRRVVIGIVVTSLFCHLVMPPFLYDAGVYQQWQKGFSMLDTWIANSLDLWMSVGIGAAISVPVTVLWMAIRAARKKKHRPMTKVPMSKSKMTWKALMATPKDRGDIPFWLAVGLYLFSASGFVVLTHGIVNLGWFGGFPKPEAEQFPMWILVVFSFLWGPVMTYINAKMLGIAGQHIGLPYVREGTFIMSGYQHPDIWVSPISIYQSDFSGATATFKVLELTRTKFTSLFKVEALAFVLLTFSGLFFFSYLWGLGPIPSDQFPYAQWMWPYMTKQSALWYSALGEGNNLVLDALKPNVIAGTAGIFVGLFLILSFSGIPVAYYFGAITGVSMFPYVAIPYMVSLIIRTALERRMGEEVFRKNKPIMAAGFAAGMGLSGMIIVMVVLIKSAITALPY